MIHTEFIFCQPGNQYKYCMKVSNVPVLGNNCSNWSHLWWEV